MVTATQELDNRFHQIWRRTSCQTDIRVVQRRRRWRRGTSVVGQHEYLPTPHPFYAPRLPTSHVIEPFSPTSLFILPTSPTSPTPLLYYPHCLSLFQPFYIATSSIKLSSNLDPIILKSRNLSIIILFVCILI